MTQQPDLPVEMQRFVKAKMTLYEWDWRALSREVAKRMASLNINATAFAESQLSISPQFLCDLTSGRRKWTFELIKRLLQAKDAK